MLGCVIGNNSHAEGKIVAPARVGIERAQFPVDSMTNRLDVVFGCFSNEDGELISAKSSKDVGLSKRVPEHNRGVNERAVPFLVAEAVIDSL